MWSKCKLLYHVTHLHLTEEGIDMKFGILDVTVYLCPKIYEEGRETSAYTRIINSIKQQKKK